MVGKLHNDLIELFNNSGKEFLGEMTELLKSQFSNKEHTILVRGESGDWKIGSSTLIDEDEIKFLLKIAETEFLDKREKWTQFSKNREGINHHIVIPLVVRNRKTAGIWIIETKKKERLLINDEVIKAANLVGVLIQSLHDERLCIYNKYLDAETSFLGRQYFQRMVERLKDRKHNVLVSVFRREDYREDICLCGYQKVSGEMAELADMVEELNLGNVFTLAEDTFAVITVEEQPEVYARMEHLIKEAKLSRSIKGVILSSIGISDILKEIEKQISLCESGRIFIPDRKKKNSLTQIFEETEKKELSDQNIEISIGKKFREKKSEDEELFSLLEREGLL